MKPCVVRALQRPRYMELRAVMTQIPNISLEALDQYDHRLIDPNSQKLGDKRRKDQFKKLIAGTFGVMPCLAAREQCSPFEISLLAAHWKRAEMLIVQIGARQRDPARVVNCLSSAAENVLQLNMAVVC